MRRALILLSLLTVLSALTPSASAAPAAITWRAPAPVGAASTHPPSLADCGTGTYLVWRDPGGGIGFGGWGPGGRWLLSSLRQSTPGAPVVACDNAVIVVLWQNPAGQLLAMRSGDGQFWSAPQPFGPAGVSAAFHAGGSPNPGSHPFYLVWKGSGADTRLFASGLAGSGWSPVRQVLNTASESAPNVLAFSDQVLVTYRDLNSAVRHTRAPVSLPGPWTVLPHSVASLTSHSPAAARVTLGSGFLAPFVVWKGNGTDTRLRTTGRFPTGTWLPVSMLSTAATDLAPTAAAAIEAGGTLHRGVLVAWRNPGNNQLVFSFGR